MDGTTKDQGERRQPAATGLGRRDVLQALLTGAGATVAWPAVAGDHPLQQHAHNPQTVASADARANRANWQPAFLTLYQFQALSLLSDAILPGSVASKSPEFIDALLAVDSEARRRRFMEAFGAMEGLALAQSRKSLKALTASERQTLLTAASTAAPGSAQTGVEPRPVTSRDHFEHLKGWISGAHYSSEAGMRELGWTGNQFFETFAGCTHPDGHA